MEWVWILKLILQCWYDIEGKLAKKLKRVIKENYYKQHVLRRIAEEWGDTEDRNISKRD